MILSKSRVDEFKSAGETLRVVGTSGHILSTDAYVKRKFRVELRAEEKQDEFTLVSRPTRGIQRGHLPEIYDGNANALGTRHAYTLQTTDMAINKSIERLNFYPLTSDNSLDVRPSTQAQLLPYLCEATAQYNMNMMTKTFSSGGDGEAFTGDTRAATTAIAPNEDALYRYKLDDKKFLLIQTVAQTNPVILGSAQCLEMSPTDHEVNLSAGATHALKTVAARTQALATGTCLVRFNGGVAAFEPDGILMRQLPVVANANPELAAAAAPANSETTRIHFPTI